MDLITCRVLSVVGDGLSYLEVKETLKVYWLWVFVLFLYKRRPCSAHRRGVVEREHRAGGGGILRRG